MYIYSVNSKVDLLPPRGVGLNGSTHVLLLNLLFIAHIADQQQDLFKEEIHSFKHVCFCVLLSLTRITS